MATITVVILTYNEEKNIEECICSFKSIADKIVILDGFSTDQTIYIAKKMVQKLSRRIADILNVFLMD